MVGSDETSSSGFKKNYFQNNSFGTKIFTSETALRLTSTLSSAALELVPTTTPKYPRLVFLTPPTVIRKIPSKTNTNAKADSLQETKRYMPYDIKEKNAADKRPLTGESGETIAANHYRYLKPLSTWEAKRFLEAYKRKPTFKDIFHNSGKTFVSSSKRPVDHKTKLKKLLRQVVREVGSIVKTTEHYKMKLKVDFNRVLRRTKRIVNNNHLTLTDHKKYKNQRPQTKINIILQINL